MQEIDHSAPENQYRYITSVLFHLPFQLFSPLKQNSPEKQYVKRSEGMTFS